MLENKEYFSKEDVEYFFNHIVEVQMQGVLSYRNFMDYIMPNKDISVLIKVIELKLIFRIYRTQKLRVNTLGEAVRWIKIRRKSVLAISRVVTGVNRDLITIRRIKLILIWEWKANSNRRMIIITKRIILRKTINCNTRRAVIKSRLKLTRKRIRDRDILATTLRSRTLRVRKLL